MKNLPVGYPIYKHDCNICTFIGNSFSESTQSVSDLYYCPQNGLPTIIIRYSDEPSDYNSGFHHYYDLTDYMKSIVDELRDWD